MSVSLASLSGDTTDAYKSDIIPLDKDDTPQRQCVSALYPFSSLVLSPSIRWKDTAVEAGTFSTGVTVMARQPSITIAKATFEDVPTLVYITIRAFEHDAYTKLVSSTPDLS